MAQQNPMLTRRACVMAKIETTPGTDASPTAALDAILVASPDFNVDLQTLERDYVRADISPLGVAVGRKLAKMKFTVELRSNGLTNTGNISNVAKMGRLLRGCGYSETAVSGAGTVEAVRTVGSPAVAPTWAISGTNANKNYNTFLLTCVLGGASATAKIRVDELNGYAPNHHKNESITISTNSAAGTVAFNQTNPVVETITFAGTWVAGERVYYNVHGYEGFLTSGSTPTPTTMGAALASALNAHSSAMGAVNSSGTVTCTYTGAMAGVVVTSGSTALALGDTTCTTTPTWAGSLALGQQWLVDVTPVGISYQPVSDNFETLTLYMYMDGILHKMTAAQGTFTINAEAGQFGTVEFEFTGQYIAPIDAAVPTSPTYETTKPPVFELAKLRADSEDITIAKFSFTQNNTVEPRMDANSSDGYFGVRITARAPEGGVDPEVVRTGNYNFFAKMATATQFQLTGRFGTVDGNIIWVAAPKVQYSGLTYQDRSGITTYDAGLRFGAETGNDEVTFFFA